MSYMELKSLTFFTYSYKCVAHLAFLNFPNFVSRIPFLILYLSASFSISVLKFHASTSTGYAISRSVQSGYPLPVESRPNTFYGTNAACQLIIK